MSEKNNKIGGIWVREKNGKEYFSIQINGVNYVAYPNGFKKESKHPDFVIFEVESNKSSFSSYKQPIKEEKNPSSNNDSNPGISNNKKYSNNSGPSKYSNNSGPSKYSNNSGPSKYSNNSGPSKYSNNSGPSKYSNNSGPSKYNNNSNFKKVIEEEEIPNC